MQYESLYSHTSSPTVEITDIFLEAAVAAKKNKKVATLDIGSAYLNADITEEIYMTLQKETSSILCSYFQDYSQFIDASGQITVKLVIRM